MLDFCTIQVRSQADYPTVGAAADYCAASRQASTACAANRQASSASRQASMSTALGRYHYSAALSRSPLCDYLFSATRRDF
jgi:hypothetical protein